MLIIMVMLLSSSKKWNFWRIDIKIDDLSLLTFSNSSFGIEEKWTRYMKKKLFTIKRNQNVPLRLIIYFYEVFIEKKSLIHIEKNIEVIQKFLKKIVNYLLIKKFLTISRNIDLKFHSNKERICSGDFLNFCPSSISAILICVLLLKFFHKSSGYLFE